MDNYLQKSRVRQLVPVEALWEFNVQEITLDGRELLEKPLTAAENFQRIVNAIDFDQTDEDNENRSRDTSTHGTSPTFDTMWSVLRDGVRNSLTELCALVDILAVLKETKYLSIFPVEPNTSEPNLALFLTGKKMALATASDTLLKGAERLRCRYSEMYNSLLSSRGDARTGKFLSYHESLINIRKCWRLKLCQNFVLGDASLRSIGSRYREGGNFEVFESDKQAKKSNGLVHSDEITDVMFSSTMESLMNHSRCTGRLKIRLYDAQSGPSFVWESLLKPNFYDDFSKVGLQSRPKNQLERICLAQNILACREIFSTLSYEASNAKIGSYLNGTIAFSTQNEVFASIFPGVQLVISLDSKPDHLLPKAEEKSTSDSHHVPADAACVLIGLSTQLRRLLHKQHISSWRNIASLPVPSTGAVQIPQRFRAAGALASSSDIFESSSSSAVQTNPSLPIVTAGVAGFAGPAASAWMSSHLADDAGLSKPGAALNLLSVGQDRHAYFTEWGSSVQAASSLPGSISNPNLHDVLSASTNLTIFEHALNTSNVGECALESVLGSGDSLLGRFILLTRHYYLRNKVANCLTRFARATDVCVNVHWNSQNSPYESSAHVTFHSAGYCRFSSRLGLTITTSGIIVYCATPQIVHLGTDLSQFVSLLRKEVIKSQIFTLHELSSQRLGWTHLASTASSTSVDLQNLEEDQPSNVILIGSPSGNHIVCLRSSTTSGLRLFVAKTSVNGLSKIATDASQLKSVVDDISAYREHDNLSLLPKGDLSSELGSEIANNRVIQHFREVDLLRVPGPHTVSKMEAILACLS